MTSAGQRHDSVAFAPLMGRLKVARRGRPPAFDPGAYKQRNTVERGLCRLRQHRAVATRHDKPPIFP